MYQVMQPDCALSFSVFGSGYSKRSVNSVKKAQLLVSNLYDFDMTESRLHNDCDRPLYVPGFNSLPIYLEFIP